MKISPFRALFCAGFLALSGATALAAPFDLATRKINLHPEDESVGSVGGLEYRGGIELRSRHPHFGGLFGLSVTKDGARIFMVTYKGWWVTLQPIHDDRGWLAGAHNGRIGKLLTPSGKPIADGGHGDGEVIARHRGALVVYFESDKKLYLYPASENPLALQPRALRTPAALKGAPHNGEIEALTTLKGSRIFALTERYSHGKNAAIGWITQNRAGIMCSTSGTGNSIQPGPPRSQTAMSCSWNAASTGSPALRLGSFGYPPPTLIRARLSGGRKSRCSIRR